MAKLPVVRGTPKLPLIISDGEKLVPAVAEDPCDCCGANPCECWRADKDGCNLPWVHLTATKVKDLGVIEDDPPDEFHFGYIGYCKFRVEVEFTPPPGVTVTHWTWGHLYFGVVDGGDDEDFILGYVPWNITCLQIEINVEYQTAGTEECGEPMTCFGYEVIGIVCCECVDCYRGASPFDPDGTCETTLQRDVIFPDEISIAISGTCAYSGTIPLVGDGRGDPYYALNEVVYPDFTGYDVSVYLSPCIATVTIWYYIDGEPQWHYSGGEIKQWCCSGDSTEFAGNCLSPDGGIIESSPVAISCSGTVEPPPDPRPPQVRNCDSLTTCPDPLPDATVHFFSFANYTAAFTGDLFGLSGTRHFTLINLNMSLTMPWTASGLTFEYDLYTPGTNYATAVAGGKQVARDEFEANAYDAGQEFWLYRVEATFVCSSGDVNFYAVKFFYEAFIKGDGITELTPNGTFPFQFDSAYLFPISNGGAFICGTSLAVMQIRYADTILFPTVGDDHSFNVSGYIGTPISL